MIPLKSDLIELKEWLVLEMEKTGTSALETENLSALNSKWEVLKDYVSGILAIQLPELNNAVLMVLRPELRRSISWGGDPRKILERRNFQGAIHPRQSFETWEQTVQFTSGAWKHYEVEGF